MTYAIRNSLIMVGVWAIMIIGGWSRFYMVEDEELNRLDDLLNQKKTELQDQKEIANNFDNLMTQYQTTKDDVDKSSKLLVKSRSADQVYSELTALSNDSAFTYFSFITVDSTHYDSFGLLKFDIIGEGYYKNFNQFINRLEYGRSLFKIREMTIEPLTELGDLGKVRYSFKLNSLFDRDAIFDNYTNNTQQALPFYSYNSFYPLIHDVKENNQNLADVEKSKLVSMGENFISLRDQDGNMRYLYVGDRVYLGKLISINKNEKSARFELNKGGIIKYITRVL